MRNEQIFCKFQFEILLQVTEPLNLKCQLFGSPQFSLTSSGTRIRRDYEMPSPFGAQFLEPYINFIATAVHE